MKPSLVFWILTPLFRKRCPDMISMGRSVKEINCFSICVDNPDGSPLLLVDSLAPPVFAGRKWNEKQYLDAHTININDVLPSQIRIRHYYGPHTIKYDGLYVYIFSGATGWEKFKADVSRLIHGTQQFIFNQKNLATKSRIDLLRFLIDHHISSKDKDVHVLGVMQALYTTHCLCHPQYDQQKEITRLLMDSLVDTGELRKIDGNMCYRITPKAMTTLNACEIDEQRHADNVKRQNQLNWLTGALVCVGLLQAFLIWMSVK
jgi:hypothetical protein